MSDQRNHMGYAFPVLEDGCTACRACRDVCPDYCFEVYRYDADPDAPASRVPAAGERD
jgi:2-oxoglutarate ferredoxin oxidoreductase subunit delta